MSEHGEYRVCGKHIYRDHVPGTVFETRRTNATARAEARGDIELLRVIQPVLQPGSYRLPVGWLSSPNQSTDTERGNALYNRKE